MRVSSSRSGLANIRERIDRGIANVPWRLSFLEAELRITSLPHLITCP